MDFQKINEAIEKSPQEIKDLLFSEEIGQFLQNIAQTNNLDEETSLKMVDEVGYLILGLKERSSFKNALTNIGIPKTSVLTIIQEVSKKIFTELDKIETTNKKVVVATPEMKIESTVATSVPEIPPINLPMIEAGEVVHDVKPAKPITPPIPQSKPTPTPSTPIQPARQDLTGVKPEPKVNAPLPDYRYPEGKDPYREPLS